MYAIIMAGGQGTRLWPLSRKNCPKQTQCVLGEKSLLEATFERLLPLIPASKIIVTVAESNFESVRKELSSLALKNFSLEPQRRDTAPALGLAAMIIEERDPQAVIVNINADAYVKNEEEYRRILLLGAKLAEEYPQYTIAVGIKPAYPETGYGYIKVGKLLKRIGRDKIFYVDSFTEKPSLSKAKQFVESGDYLWNPTLFFWKVETFIKLLKKYQPKMYQHLKRIQRTLGKKNYKKILKEGYSEIKPISIDYALIEKTKKMLVIPAEFGWSDVGHWQSVQEILADGKKNNVVQADELVSIDTENSLIYVPQKKVVAVVGLKDMIVVDSPDALLICPKRRAQEVKQIVKLLEERGREEYL